MKKAFTLIELLVVIAIIAILAAILFPVFAQAKAAAKRTQTLSNVKNVGTAIQLYMADYDDILPRQDTCDEFLMNPALKGAVPFPAGGNGAGCTSGAGTYGFIYRKNHFDWQTWVYPYVKNVEIFFNPLRQRGSAWDTSSEIVDQFGINTGLTGALNTWTNAVRNLAPGNGSFRNSWTGGSGTAIAFPSEAFILMEIGGHGTAHITHATQDPFVPSQTTFPVAIREFWRYRLMEGTAADCVNSTRGTQPDSRKTSNGLVILGFMDSSAKAIPASRFLAQTPTLAETSTTITFNAAANCNFSNPGGNIGISTAGMNTSVNYPMWNFGG
jgi:prepilin-type N-terminal cleavage/methylation domain-containing protein